MSRWPDDFRAEMVRVGAEEASAEQVRDFRAAVESKFCVQGRSTGRLWERLLDGAVVRRDVLDSPEIRLARLLPSSSPVVVWADYPTPPVFSCAAAVVPGAVARAPWSELLFTNTAFSFLLLLSDHHVWFAVGDAAPMLSRELCR